MLAEFARLLEPPAEVFTPHGATEALPVSSIGSNEILGETRQHSGDYREGYQRLQTGDEENYFAQKCLDGHHVRIRTIRSNENPESTKLHRLRKAAGSAAGNQRSIDSREP